MQRQEHPNHHLPVLIIPVALFAGLIGTAVVLGMTLNDPKLLFIIVGVMAVSETIAGIVVVSQMLKKCQCPDCKRVLDRDTDPSVQGIAFPCESCSTVYVSKIGGGQV